jgi:hypothetical protein
MSGVDKVLAGLDGDESLAGELGYFFISSSN